MFKYFALAFDFFLAITYSMSNDQIVYFVFVPPILHTLAFFITPHCYKNHCKPIVGKYSLKVDQNTQNQTQATAQITEVDMLGTYLSSLPNPNPNPSPSAFTARSSSSHQSSYPSPQLQSRIQQYTQCKECKLHQWIRMHHCYHCNTCVHKYDHHCVLLGICIGEANQKYYVPFLWTFLFSSIMQVHGYCDKMDEYIQIDELGYEKMQRQYVCMSFAVIFFVCSFLVVGYLVIMHTIYAIKNSTTFEINRRQKIKYFEGVTQRYPFDEGIYMNLKRIIMASRKNPYEWLAPQRNVEIELNEIGNNNHGYVNIEDRRQEVLNDLDNTFAQIRT